MIKKNTKKIKNTKKKYIKDEDEDDFCWKNAVIL